jgi:hypothetical protein
MELLSPACEVDVLSEDGERVQRVKGDVVYVNGSEL